MLVRESAAALASFSRDPAALVTACRRLVDRQSHAAAVWWLAARVLVAAEPAHEAWQAADEVDEDCTPVHLIDQLPHDASVLVIGWPETIAPAIAKRGDLDVLIVDALDQGSGLVRRLDRVGIDATLVDERGIGAAAASVDVVLLEAMGLGGSAITALTCCTERPKYQRSKQPCGCRPSARCSGWCLSNWAVQNPSSVAAATLWWSWLSSPYIANGSNVTSAYGR